MSLESRYTARLVVHRPTSAGGDLAIDFERWTGGTIDSEETKHRNVVTRKETARGGQRTRSNVTLARECDAAMWALRAALEDSAGRDPVTAVRQMIDARNTAVGDPVTVTGLMKAPTYPDYDLASTDVGMLEIEISADE